MANTQANPEKTNIHAGHRNRLRTRYDKAGLDDFEPHQVLELFLTYIIRRKDVNEEAHALIDRFGSLSAVLDASCEELCTVKGIGPETARFLKLIPALFRLYALDKCTPVTDALDTEEKMMTFLQALFVGEQTEKMYLLLFDNSLRLINCTCVGEGTVNSVQVSVRKITELALSAHASAAVIAHNHPKGLAIPSGDDHLMTDRIAGALDVIDVQLLEHILVTDRLCTSILRNRRGILRASPADGGFGEAFWRRFYGIPQSAADAEGLS